MEEYIFDAIKQLSLNNIEESDIQKQIIEYLISKDYLNFKKNYRQAHPRIKNLHTRKPDIVVKKDDQVYLIEIKFLPDARRNSNRLERAFVDCAYLKNEIKINQAKGYFVLVDYENSGYFKRKEFIKVCESILEIKLSVHTDFELINHMYKATLLILEIELL